MTGQYGEFLGSVLNKREPDSGMTLTLTMEEAAQQIGGGVTPRWVRDKISQHQIPVITGSRGRKLVAIKHLERLLDLAGNTPNTVKSANDISLDLQLSAGSNRRRRTKT